MLDRVRLHHRVDRALARPDGDGLSRPRRHAARCGCPWAERPPTAEIDEVGQVVPAVIDRQRQGIQALAGAGQRSRDLAASRAGGGGMTERVLVAMSGGVDSSVAAALVARSGADAVGVWMRLHDGADSFSDVKRSLLLGRRRGRRPPCREPAGHPVLRPGPGARVRSEVCSSRSWTAYLSGRPPARASTATRTVKFGALLGRARRLYDCRRGGDRALRARPVGSGSRRVDDVPTAGGGRPGQGPELLPVRPRRRTSWHTPASRSGS